MVAEEGGEEDKVAAGTWTCQVPQRKMLRRDHLRMHQAVVVVIVVHPDRQHHFRRDDDDDPWLEHRRLLYVEESN